MYTFFKENIKLFSEINNFFKKIIIFSKNINFCFVNVKHFVKPSMYRFLKYVQCIASIPFFAILPSENLFQCLTGLAWFVKPPSLLTLLEKTIFYLQIIE